jgi:hypothetical protein
MKGLNMLTELEKEIVIERLDDLEDAVKVIVLASLEALAEWLAKSLYSIYLKIKDALANLWDWLRSIFV